MVEGDEYDSAFFDKRPKFVHYLPDVAIIGNVEYDHADIYPDLAAVQTRVRAAAERRPAARAARGRAGEPGAARAAAARAARRWRPSASSEGADWRAVDVRPRGRRLALPPARCAGPATWASSRCRLAGEHNLRNALAALAAADAAGVAARRRAGRPRRASAGVKRRLEVRGRGARRRRSTTTSRTTRPRCARRCARCARVAPAARAAWSPSSSRARTRRARASSRTTSPAPSQDADRVLVAGRAPAGQGAGGAAPLRGASWCAAIAELGRRRRASSPRWTTIVAQPGRDAAGGGPGGRSSPTAASAGSTRSCCGPRRWTGDCTAVQRRAVVCHAVRHESVVASIMSA